MAISVTAPIDRALNRTREVLFDPFDLSKWLALGFCAFLANLGTGSGGGSSGHVASWQEPSRRAGRTLNWVRENWELVVAIGGVALLVLLAIATAVLWLQARGRFMFLDGVVRNRGAVVEPWKTCAAAGNSAFRFELCLWIVGLVCLLIIAAIGFGIAWIDIRAERLGAAAVGGILVGGSLFSLLAMAAILIDVLMTDFVIPAMYARRIGVMAGWGVVVREVLAAHTGAVVLYLLVRILIALVSGALLVGVVCATLCIAACFLAIPYVGTVLALPLLVFPRCYSLYFLEQLGEEWELLSAHGAT